MSAALRNWLSRALPHALLLPAALLVVMPFLWMLGTAFKPPAEIFEVSLWPLPRSWFGFTHFQEVLRSAPMGRL